MRELGLAGVVAILFGLGSYYATRDFGTFSLVNLLAGSTALIVALGAAARRLGAVGGPHARRVIARGLLFVAAALALGTALERTAAWSDVRFDWTFEQRFDISEAVMKKLGELPQPVTATLYFDPLDPRVRRTRMLLDEIARVSGGRLVPDRRVLADHPEEADRFAIGSSNTVVLQIGDAFDTVPRPTEGALYEALYRLDARGTGRVLILRGEGEGDPNRDDELGYAGFAAALATEGYEVQSRVAAALREVPEDTDAVIAIAPERPLLPGALAALRRYLEAGGTLVALLEPGRETGLEALLAEYGIHSPDALVVDPASRSGGGSGAEGIDIIAFNYEAEPVTRGLNPNRMTFFPGVRPLRLRKPRPEDDVRRLVLSSSRAWVSDDLSWLERRSGRPERAGQPEGYQALAASGRYPRGGREARLIVFGDADFASNRHLRALYNLDLALNAVHWATQHEPEITLRPKLRSTVQFPLPLNNSVQALYSVGLLLPELLLIAGGIVWLRRRSA
jgi:hypothetical protein